MPLVKSDVLRGNLYESVRSLMFELPQQLKAESASSMLFQNGIQVEYFHPNPKNVALETLAKLKPQTTAVIPEIVMAVPQGKSRDEFALRFTGQILIPKAGKYTFFLASDDGSRLYLGDKLLIDNDGLHGMVEKSASIDLPAGGQSLIVTYFDNGGGDGLEVQWSGPGLKRQKIAADRLSVSGGEETLHDLAIHTVASIPGHGADKFRDLVQLIKTDRNRSSAISTLKTVPESDWSAKELPSLVDNIIGYLSSIPARARTSGPAVEAIALARSFSQKLPPDQAKGIEDRLQNLDVRVISVGTVVERMIYDKEIIVVQAGKPVEFRISNTDHMPHNFAILQPGALEEVGLLAEATARDADAKDRQYVPKSDKILLASRLLEPGQTQALSFETPAAVGVYPYVCTYPGHWRRMYGALYVVANLEEYQRSPEAYLSANPLPMKDEMLKYTGRNTEWKFDDLVAAVKPLPHGRSYEVGRNLFKVANCVGCHKLAGEGRELGPDLTKIEPTKRTTDLLLRSILEPSKEIAEKYQSHAFLLDSGKIVTGMIVEENATQIKVLADPLAKGEPAVIQKSDIEERSKSTTSIMPQGLLNKLTREEILDLLAYVYAGGDKKHALFEMHHH